MTTTTSWLDRVPLDEISAQAHEMRPGRAILSLIAGLIFTLAWVTAKSWKGLWFGLAWAGAAWKVGWNAAQGKTGALPPVEQVLAENARLRAELARIT